MNKYKKPKSGASAPKGARKPFSTIKTDTRDRAGQKFHPGILAKNSPQNKFHTGATLLAKAVGTLKKA